MLMLLRCRSYSQVPQPTLWSDCQVSWRIWLQKLVLLMLMQKLICSWCAEADLLMHNSQLAPYFLFTFTLFGFTSHKKTTLVQFVWRTATECQIGKVGGNSKAFSSSIKSGCANQTDAEIGLTCSADDLLGKGDSFRCATRALFSNSGLRRPSSCALSSK